MRRSFLRQLVGDYRRKIEPAPLRPTPEAWSPDQVTVAWLGHATVLINFFGLTILTDPVFFARIGLRFGPLTIGPKRYVACALPPRELPPIDLLLLSHGHMDHLDLKSLRKLRRDCTVITARHTADIFRDIAFQDVHEIGWGEERVVKNGKGELKVAAFQLRHWGARMQWDTHRTYNAYILERGGYRLCFTGDTARTAAHELGSRGPIDLMMVPISAYNPWIDNHCTPEEAVEMADEAGARYLAPIHHETFRLSWEPMDEPIARFRAALAKTPERIALTRIGETFVLPNGERPSANTDDSETFCGRG
ncbi:MBL fold metallo-hydrolase [Verrucomicrobiota bacterium sgz303538]